MLAAHGQHDQQHRQLDGDDHLHAVGGPEADRDQAGRAGDGEEGADRHRRGAEQQPGGVAVAAQRGPHHHAEPGDGGGHEVQHDQQQPHRHVGCDHDVGRQRDGQQGDHGEQPVQLARTFAQRHHLGEEQLQRGDREQRHHLRRHVVPPGPVRPHVQARQAGERGLREGHQHRRQGVEGVAVVAQRHRADHRQQGGQPHQADVGAQAERDALFAAPQVAVADELQRRAEDGAILHAQQVHAGRLRRHGDGQDRVAVRNRPVGHGDRVAGAARGPAARGGLGVQRHLVDAGIGHLEVPALRVSGGGRHEADPQRRAVLNLVDVVVAGGLPVDGGIAGDVLHAGLAAFVHPGVARVAQPHGLARRVELQHGPRPQRKRHREQQQYQRRRRPAAPGERTHLALLLIHCGPVAHSYAAGLRRQ